MVAEILYHGLTTGCGAQTLGEEYCDILQVSGDYTYFRHILQIRPCGPRPLSSFISNLYSDFCALCNCRKGGAGARAAAPGPAGAAGDPGTCPSSAHL